MSQNRKSPLILVLHDIRDTFTIFVKKDGHRDLYIIPFYEYYLLYLRQRVRIFGYTGTF